MLSRKLIIPVVLAAVAGGAIAGAFLGVPLRSGAQTSTTETTAPGSTQPGGGRGPGLRGPHGGPAEIEAAADALGLTPEELLDKLDDGQTTIADVATEQQVDLQDVIDAMVEADRARIEDMVQQPLQKRDHDGRGFGFGHRLGLKAALEDIAGVLGMTPDELKDALRDGKTLAEIAQEKNVAVDDVVNAIVAAGDKRIDEAKDAGRLTQEEADNMKERLRTFAERLVNGDLPGPGGGFGRFGFGMERPRRG
jgi:hypothetical protein